MAYDRLPAAKKSLEIECTCSGVRKAFLVAGLHMQHQRARVERPAKRLDGLADTLERQLDSAALFQGVLC